MTPRIVDGRLEEIYNFRTCPDLPAAVGQAAHRLARLLIAARSLNDLFCDYACEPDGTMSVHVEGRWFITFVWDESVGVAKSLALERF